jgi:glucosamine-6-phosphate deaminase
MQAPVRVLEIAGASVLVFADRIAACHAAADRIAETVHSALATRGRAVLGLATGATPGPVYERVVALHCAGKLPFDHVSTYNLDEYYPISPADPCCYRTYMHRHLFSQINQPANQAHMFDGTVPEAFVAEHAAQYERWIAGDGGLDLQLLGLGRNGHIGFNEPVDLPLEQALRLPTRLVDLDPITRVDAVRDFGDEAKVIPRALTLGVASILSARAVLVLAFGTHKASPVAQALKGPPTSLLPGSLLQTIPGRVTWMLDEAAAEHLN